MKHNLKTWPEFFEAILSGEKTFELRKDDRGFRVGDVLILQEWLPKDQKYTGREQAVKVIYLMAGMGLQSDYVVMAVKKLAVAVNSATEIETGRH